MPPVPFSQTRLRLESYSFHVDKQTTAIGILNRVTRTGHVSLKNFNAQGPHRMVGKFDPTIGFPSFRLVLESGSLPLQGHLVIFSAAADIVVPVDASQPPLRIFEVSPRRSLYQMVLHAVPVRQLADHEYYPIVPLLLELGRADYTNSAFLQLERVPAMLEKILSCFHLVLRFKWTRQPHSFFFNNTLDVFLDDPLAQMDAMDIVQKAMAP